MSREPHPGQVAFPKLEVVSSYCMAKLERDIDGVTQKMLLEQLKELMDYGFVEKKSYEGYPVHVEYSLTDGMGTEILEALRIMHCIC